MNTPETDEIVKTYESQRESVGGIIEHAESLERERDEARTIAERAVLALNRLALKTGREFVEIPVPWANVKAQASLLLK